MSITIVSGDMFKSEAEAICNPVNCVGVMGAGLAKEFWARFPDRCMGYKNACKEGTLMPGRVLSHADGRRSPKTIFHVATKNHWSRPSRLEWVAAGVRRIAELCVQMKIASIAVPALGCGKGGLSWETVRSVIEKTFTDVAPHIAVELYPPQDEDQLPQDDEKAAARPKRAKAV